MNSKNDQQAIIDVKGLHKSFNDIKAVKNLTLKIQPGTIFGFLGPNGSGKTVSLRLLCGLLMPDGGEGFCLGLNLITETKLIQEQVGYMPQQFSLYKHLTVYENLDFIGRIYGLKERKKKLQEIIEIFSLKERQHQLAHTLSGGWQQRVSLATAILHSPRILFLDEPTSGIDPQSRILIWDFIQKLVKKGTTVVVSTHHMDEAERCHELAYMVNGKILTHGTVDEVISSAGLFTWRIIGKKLAELVPRLKAYPGLVQVIEKGNEIRISTLDPQLIKKIVTELQPEYEVRETETSLEDVFTFKIKNEEK